MTNEQAEYALENAVNMLSHLIAKSPPLSYTAEMARRTLTAVKNPDSSMTTVRKLEVVMGQVRGFRDRQRLDSSHHHPGDRPNGVIQ